MHTLQRIIALRTLAVALAIGLFVLLGATTTHAAPDCDFYRDLDIGIEGEDVLCLQEYLNSIGYALAESGPGAPGSETNRFGGLTRDALARWQEANAVFPSSGYFGPRTRAAMQAGTPTANESAGTTVPTLPGLPSTDIALGLEGVLGALSPADREQADELLALFKALGLTEPGSTGASDDDDEPKDDDDVVSVSQAGSQASDLILKAIRMLRDAEDEIDDSNADAESLIGARTNYDDAQEDLLDAMYAYLTGDSEEALEAADDAYDNAKDAFEEAGGTTLEDEVDERYEALKDEIDDAWDEINDREDDGNDIDDAEDYLFDAEDYLKDAKVALEEERFGDADDLLDDVEDAIEDALDSIVSGKEADAQKDIDDAKEAIDDAFDEIRDARDDGDDVDEAEDELDKAEELLKDARDAFDDEDWDEASNLAKDAEDYAERAVDAL